jgi:hypothetical protein
MSQEKYIGMDVHQATISVAVRDSGGKLIMECILETKAATILEFIQGMRGTLAVTFEEGTCAAWLHDLLKPHLSRLVVCDPRKNALLKDGSKSDRIDARKLAELLRGNQLSPVYHGDHGVRTLKELSRSYLTITKDLTRVMSRIGSANLPSSDYGRDARDLGVYVRHGDSTSNGLAIPEQREHDFGVSQVEWRSWHTTAADLGSVFGIIGTDQEVATSCDQPVD